MFCSQCLLSFIFFVTFHLCVSESFQKQILEARQLYPFRAYKDVQLLHYTLPHQVAFASFQYKANGSAHCPLKTVAVYLQYGSYPVMSLQNASFPDHFAIKRQFLHNITMLSDTVPLTINITNPLPGNWYAAAFLFENTERIAQKGLFTPCFSWLSSSVKYHAAENIISVLQNSKTPQNINGIQNYRFFANENSWLSKIQINNCSELFHNRCAVILTSRPMGIPVPKNHEESYFINCTLTETCLIQMIPAINNWNYISVENLTPSLEFNLVIETEGCETSVLSESEDFQQLDVLNGSEIAFLTVEAGNKSSNESCWPRIMLDRISQPTNLAFEYNLPAEEEDIYPFILNITDSKYTFTRFEVLPIVDIGGTLVIELAISPFMNHSQIDVSVFGCLSYGVRSASEDVDCEQGISLSVNTSVKENILTTLFVPYPEAGMWYLRLLSQCSNLVIDNSSLFPFACDSNQTPIFLRIRSTPCMLGNCGSYGTCYQYVSGGLIFSTCNCIAGWKGWGCTDNSTAKSNSELILDVLLLTLSNLLFIPAIILSICRKYYTEAFVYFATMVSSSFYHACDSEVYSFCLVRINVLQFCDFYSAILSVWITVIAMAKLPNSLQTFVYMSGAIGVSFGVEYDRTGLWVFVLPTGIGLTILITSWISRCYKKKSCYPERKVWLLYLLPGASLALAGLIFYSFFETKDNYPYVHSAWHATIAVSVLFLLPKRKASHISSLEPNVSCSYVRVGDVSCPDISNPVVTPYAQLLAPSP